MWNYIKSEPFDFILILTAVFIGLCMALWLMRYIFHIRQAKKLIFLRITLSREESSKDKEKDTEKDFREKISIMAQFFRNLHETRELNLWNQIMTRIFKHNIFTFELVAHQKVVDFFITAPPYYAKIIEKQVTSYYPNADIQPMKAYEHHPKGNKVKGYSAFAQKKYWFPIKTFKTIENDPLNSLTNIFSKLTADETAIIQVVIRPRNDRWSKKAEKVSGSYFKGKKTGGVRIPVLGQLFNVLKGVFLGYDRMVVEPKQSGDGYVRMLQAKEEVAKRMGEKANQSGFDTVIRLLATSSTERRAEEISNNMVVGFSLFKDSLSNWLQTRRIIAIDSLNDKWFLFNFKNRLLDTRLFGIIGERRRIMAEDELSSIYHFPSSRYNYSPTIRWMDYKVLPAPINTPDNGILIGHNIYRGYKKEIKFQRKDRSRHHYVIGKSGSGKSSLLSFMARQDIQNGEGVCVIDPHGDLIEDLLNYVPKERAKDVVVFDPSDIERPMGLNMLEAKDSAEMDLISTQATEIFIKLFGDEIFGPRIQHYFRNACLTLMEDPEEGATIIDIPRIFTDEAFLKSKVKKAKNPVVKSFWQHEFANTADRERLEMIPYFNSKFGPFITNSIMRNTIGQKKSAFDFRKIMDEGKILFVKLSKGKIGDINTQLLGLVIVSRIQMAAMSRVDTPEEKRRDFFLYVDEFQNFATDSFCSILSEARKYHLNLIMAHQYINQLVVTKYGTTSTQIRDAVFGNVGTLSSFKVGADDAEYLAKEYAPLLSEQDVIGISNYKMYTKLNIDNTTSRPFSINTIWDTTGKSPKIAKIVREYSRLKYGRKRKFVEEEITVRIGIDFDAPPVDLDKLPGLPGDRDQMPPGGMEELLSGAMPPAEPAEPAEEETPPEKKPQKKQASSKKK